uniref:Ovule protein n=1 Tax=Angiostrongylus cantonensis TaxID=6313 RepID=A0A0K0DGP6_ANGCA
MANEDEKGRVPAAALPSSEKNVGDTHDVDEKDALLAKEKEAAEKLSPSRKIGELKEQSFTAFSKGRLFLLSFRSFYVLSIHLLCNSDL